MKDEKIKVIVWEQDGNKLVQEASEAVTHIESLTEDDVFSCWVEDKEEIKLTAKYMTREELDALPEFQGF